LVAQAEQRIDLAEAPVQMAAPGVLPPERKLEHY
jgi:hypothetical protein